MRAVATSAAVLALLAPGIPDAGAPDPAPGRKIFSEIAEPPCGVCHTLKAAGAAGKLGPSLDELKPDEPRALKALRDGVGVMPSYADKLTPEQLEAVAEYVARVAGQPG